MPRESERPLYRVDLEPLDPLLFGDNRAARAGLDHFQLDQDPSPITVHGAIGRFLLERSKTPWPEDLLGERVEDVLAPSGAMAELAGYCHRGPAGTLLFPRPLHLRLRRRQRGDLTALDLLAPRPWPDARTSSREPELLAAPEEDEAEGEILLSETALSEVLCGRLPSAGFHDKDELFRSEPRPGIAVDNRLGSVFEGMFFTRPYRRFRPGRLDPERPAPAGLRAWFRTLGPIPQEVAADRVGFLGGDRRRARLDFESCPGSPAQPLTSLLEAVAAAVPGTRGPLLYLLTPALAGSTLPDLEGGARPVAAALGKPRYASGWDVRAGRPRELVALLPAGSVFYYEWPGDAADDDARADLVRRLWTRPVQERGGAVGFGRALAGVWS